MADAAGLTVPRSHNEISFSVDGPGEVVAVDNGGATSFESFQAPHRKAFNGLALVIVRAKKNMHGEFTVKANSPRSASASVTIHAQ